MCQGYVYLLHFDEPIAHAKHYIGWSKEHPEKEGGRIEQHRKGQAARLTQVLLEKQIGFTVTRIWEDVDRNFERRLKNMKCSPKYCPTCRKKK